MQKRILMHRINFTAAVCTILTFCLTTPSTAAAPPTRLTTDLVEHTDRIWIDGNISQLTLDSPGKIIEHTDYVAVYSRNPHFGWQVNDGRNDVMQTAWRIQAGTSREAVLAGNADMWDSGMQSGSNSTSVRYEGKELRPGTVYFWRVMTWNNGEPQGWSRIRAFRTAENLEDYRCPEYPLMKTTERASAEYVSDSVLFFDFGTDAFGQLVVTSYSEHEDTLTVSLGECLKDGRIDPSPGGTRRYLSRKLALLPGRHTYYIKIPADKRNTGRSAVKMPENIGEVFPFRYCELKGAAVKGMDADVCRNVVHYQFDDTAARFTCSDTLLQQIWNLCRHSMKVTSFAGLYVDGDRERIPYEGDAVINQLSHYATDREYTLARRTHEYLLTHATWPAEWVLQSVSMAWNDYMYTADKRSLEHFYGILKYKTLTELAGTDGLLHVSAERQSPEFKKDIHLTFGNKIESLVDWPACERDGYQMSDTCTVTNAYYYQALVLMGKIAETLGREKDAAGYRQKAAALKETFSRTFRDRKSGLYRDGAGRSHKSLHANMFPLAFGLVEEKDIDRTLDFIRSKGMACSVYASQFLLDGLYGAFAGDYAFELLTSRSLRSWHNMIRSGSTVTMEAWDDSFKPNQDWNHAWGAVPGNIITRKLMGVEPLEPGFAKMRIRPQPGALKEASIEIPTIRGDVEAAFSNLPEAFTLEVRIPANTVAEIWIPAGKCDGKTVVTVNGKETKDFRLENGFVRIPDSGSGYRKFTVTR